MPPGRREASGLAANPFESVLRAIALDVAGLDLQPQVVIDEDGCWEQVMFDPDYVRQCLTLVASGRAGRQETRPRRGRLTA